jgi:hypothetical protein
MSRIHELSERPRQDGDLAAVLDAAYDASEDMLTCIRAVEDPDEQIGRRGKSHQPHGRVRRPSTERLDSAISPSAAPDTRARTVSTDECSGMTPGEAVPAVARQPREARDPNPEPAD